MAQATVSARWANKSQMTHHERDRKSVSKRHDFPMAEPAEIPGWRAVKALLVFQIGPAIVILPALNSTVRSRVDLFVLCGSLVAGTALEFTLLYGIAKTVWLRPRYRAFASAHGRRPSRSELRSIRGKFYELSLFKQRVTAFSTFVIGASISLLSLVEVARSGRSPLAATGTPIQLAGLFGGGVVLGLALVLGCSVARKQGHPFFARRQTNRFRRTS